MVNIARNQRDILGAVRTYNVGNGHTRRRPQEQRSSSELVDQQGTAADTRQHVEDLQTTIDQRLLRRVGNTDGVKHQSEVVRDNTVPTPLRSNTEDEHNKETPPVRRGRQDTKKALFLGVALNAESLLDL